MARSHSRIPVELPPQAELAYAGALFDIYSWDQKLFDGTTAKFERIARPDTVIIIPTIGENLILIEELQPDGTHRISFPTGRVEETEDIQKAALRELKEETGVTPDSILKISTENVGAKFFWDLHFYISIGGEKSMEIHPDGGEKIRVFELNLEQAYTKFKNLEIRLPKILLYDLINLSKEDFLEKLKNPKKYF